MTLSADGYNTVGKLNISFDTEKLEKDYASRSPPASKSR